MYMLSGRKRKKLHQAKHMDRLIDTQMDGQILKYTYMCIYIYFRYIDFYIQIYRYIDIQMIYRYIDDIYLLIAIQMYRYIHIDMQIYRLIGDIQM